MSVDQIVDLFVAFVVIVDDNTINQLVEEILSGELAK